jgi:hypothetical protein
MRVGAEPVRGSMGELQQGCMLEGEFWDAERENADAPG